HGARAGRSRVQRRHVRYRRVPHGDLCRSRRERARAPQALRPVPRPVEAASMTRPLAAFCAGAVLSLAAATAAPAGTPGGWTSIVAGANAPSASQELGLARTPDGRLNVAWSSDLAAVHAASITAAGQVGSPTTPVSGWSLGGDPTLVTAGGGLRLFF